MTTVDKEGLSQAYEEVRDDNNELSWAVLSYDVNNINVSAKGTDYEEFLSHFTDDQRLFAYLRVYCGDEMSKRAKFVFVQWNGREVGVLKKAKMSVDKSLVQTVIKNFAIDILAEELADLTEDVVTEKTRKAGGANYGTGV